MDGLDKPEEATKSEATKPITDVEALLSEYFYLKAKDKAIRVVRNKYMETHQCLNAMRPTSDFKDMADYDENGGQCIHKEIGWGGYPAPLCEVCQKRNTWYLERQKMSHRRAAIMRKLKRLVPVIDLATTDQEPPRA